MRLVQRYYDAAGVEAVMFAEHLGVTPVESMRLNARIEAAAKAVWELTGGKWENLINKENVRYRARVAIAAADAVESSDAEKLREALRPFAEAADIFDHNTDETLHIHPHVPLSDYRRARSLLALSESVSSPETPEMSTQTGESTAFWNGEPAEAIRVKVLVPRHSWPAWLDADASPLRHAVRVIQNGSRFFIDNEDGSGWAKVTNGYGSPRYGHRSLPIGCAVSSGDSDWCGRAQSPVSSPETP